MSFQINKYLLIKSLSKGFPGGPVVESLPPMQRTWVRSLTPEDHTCLRASQLSPCPTPREDTTMESPCPPTREQLPIATTGENLPANNTDPAQPKINWLFQKPIKTSHRTEGSPSVEKSQTPFQTRSWVLCFNFHLCCFHQLSNSVVSLDTWVRALGQWRKNIRVQW